MKAFITGGTGFIGSHLADTLAGDGHEVRCLVRKNEKWLQGLDYTRIRGDLHDLVALGQGMDGVDVIFHLAAVVSANKQSEFTYSNVEATENVLRLAMKARVPKVIILSSLAATGPSFNRPVTETDPLMPVSMYGESKKEMELLVNKLAGDRISVTIIRPPAVYGPREEQIYTFFKTAARGLCTIIGDGHSTRISLVHVRDVVHGMMLAAAYQNPGVNTYFISSEETYTWHQIRDATSEALGRKLYTVHVSPDMVKKIAGMIESAASFFGHYPVINREKANELVLEWTCSVDKARDELGYRQQVSLREGIHNTISWYRKHNWI
ncbi:MAG: NAD-dependent epimerase/dehydratase family protein [Cyclonatronaceae bacterium]